MKVKVINTSNNPLPEYATSGSSGMDARASFSNLNPRDLVKFGPVVYTCDLFAKEQVIKMISIQPGARVLIPTDLYVEIPEGYEIQVRPRSGLALKQGLMVVNSPGTIDSDYRNGIGVIVMNTSTLPIDIMEGDRICQLVLQKVEQIEWEEVDTLESSDRGEGGFGHSGIK